MGTALLDKRQETMCASHSLLSSLNRNSQSRKVSIGIMVERTPKTGPAALQGEQPFSLPPRQRFFVNEKSALDACGSDKKVILGEETSAQNNRSPWVSTRSRNNEHPEVQNIRLFQDEVSKLQNEDWQHREPSVSNRESRGKIDNAADTTDKIVVQESSKLHQESAGEKLANASSETLKRKLWEVLGGTATESKKACSPQVATGDVNHSAKEQNMGASGGQNGRSKLSDTIETDSQKPMQAGTRRVTRSSTQKKQVPRQSVSNYRCKITEGRKQPPSKSKSKRQVSGIRVFSFDGQEVGASSVPLTKNPPKITKNNAKHVARKQQGLEFSAKPSSSRNIQHTEKDCASSPQVNSASKLRNDVAQTDSGVELVENPIPKIVSPDNIFPDQDVQNPSPSPLPAVATAAITSMSPKKSSFGGSLATLNVKINRKQHKSFIPKEISRKSTTKCHESPSIPLLQVGASTKNQINPRTDKAILDQRKLETDPASADKYKNLCSQPAFVDAQETGAPYSPMPIINLKRIFSEERMRGRECKSPTLQKPTSNLRELSMEISSRWGSSQMLESSNIQETSIESMSLRSASPVEDGVLKCSINTAVSSQLQCGCEQGRFNKENSKVDSRKSEMNEPCEVGCCTGKNAQRSWMLKSSEEKYELNDPTEGSKWRDIFHDIGSKKKSPFSAHCNKALSSPDAGSEDLNPPPFSFLETHDTPQTTEQPPEDSLLRAVSQLAIIFEQIKSKIILHANKKSSEILSSVKDKIQLQLHNLESQIQADVREFSSLANSKRKHLESTFNAQQENLKAINMKFKEEMTNHLLECRATLEELETFQLESKGTIEKQRLMHRKLIMQMEEAMESHLCGAKRSMTDTQKVSRKKMNGLKHFVQKLLDEGISDG